MSEKEIRKVIDDYNELRRKIEKFIAYNWSDMNNPEAGNVLLREDGVIEADIEYRGIHGYVRQDTVTILLADFESFIENMSEAGA